MNLLPTSSYFVLSTGRTGTTFLYELLLRTHPALNCFQEPPPGWPFQLYSNLVSEGRIGNFSLKWARQHFIRSRKKIFQKMRGGHYIEINPFLYGLGPMLREVLGEIRILHLIRHPMTYIPSVLHFKPAGWRAWFVDMPVWNLNVAKAMKNRALNWSRLSDIERKAWQWVCVNQKIHSYQSFSAGYLRIRFEDLFSDQDSEREDAVHRIFEFLELSPPAALDKALFHKKINPGPAPEKPSRPWDPKMIASVLAICGETMEKFGYPKNLKPASLQETVQLPNRQAWTF